MTRERKVGILYSLIVSISFDINIRCFLNSSNLSCHANYPLFLGSRNSSRRGKPAEPHENGTGNISSPPASPRPYFLSTDGLDERSSFIPDSLKYATIGVNRTKKCDIKSMYTTSSSNTCPREGQRRFELYAKNAVPSLLNSSNESK